MSERKFAIKAVVNGKYVRAHKDKGNRLMAISKNIGDQERFKLIELDECQVYALEAYNSAYVTVGEGDELIADKDHIKQNEKFSINQEGDHFYIVALRNEKVVSMDFEGDQHLRANKDHILDWEKFIIGTVDDALNWNAFKIEPKKA
jgi:hypothetical protein